jgi:hypothetical protein
MSFKQLVDETFAEAWERYHGLMTDLPTISMEDWELTQGFYYGLSQEANEHIDTLAGGTFSMLNADEVRALFEKLSASERESEEHGLKENSRTVKIDTRTRKFQGMALTNPQQVQRIKRSRKSLHNHLMGRKYPCLGLATMLSSTSFRRC